jgi:AbrB family looped-hinge helix DNA binding protein
MTTVTVSSEYTVEIPQEARERLGIQPGQKLHVLLYDGRIELVKSRPIEEMRGFVKGIDTSIEREPDRV